MIIIRPTGGLCNRMRAILDAYSLSKDLNMGFMIVWDIDWRMGCTFNDIFENIEGVNVINLHSNDTKSRSYVEKLIKKSMVVNDTWSGSTNVFIGGNKTLDIDFFLKLKAKDIFISTCFEFYNRKNPIESLGIFKTIIEIRETVNRIMASGKLIGIHIRRTDNQEAIEHSPLVLFEKTIDEELVLNDSRFFLATDDINVENYLRGKYQGRIITNTHKDFSRETRQGAIDAVIDLYCLSECTKIYGSYYSSFTDIAAQINNISLIRVIK